MEGVTNTDELRELPQPPKEEVAKAQPKKAPAKKKTPAKKKASTFEPVEGDWMANERAKDQFHRDNRAGRKNARLKA